MAMKLDAALKLYIGLYVVMFALTWLISVPMLVHTTPQAECLLFVTPYIKYGNPASCNFVGFAPLLVALGALILLILHVVQLRSLKAFLRKQANHTADYHHRPTHIFWRMVIFHGCMTLLVLIITAIVTAGYIETCQNLYREVQTFGVRYSWGLSGGYQRRYTNQARDTYGESQYETSITCRNVLTDPEMTRMLKKNHADNPYYTQYFGFYYGDDIADYGNIRFYTYRNNLILEMAMAGCWISFAIWLAVLILMLKERHHLKAHIMRGDDSILGSTYGGKRMSSRMSERSYDSGMSGSRYSGRSRPTTRSQLPDQMSYQGSIQGSVRSSSKHPHFGPHGRPPVNGTHQNHSLLEYFANNPPTEEEVDVDAALQDHELEHPDEVDLGPPVLMDPIGEPGHLDTSFGSDNLEKYGVQVPPFEQTFDTSLPLDPSLPPVRPGPANPYRQKGRRGQHGNNDSSMLSAEYKHPSYNYPTTPAYASHVNDYTKQYVERHATPVSPNQSVNDPSMNRSMNAPPINQSYNQSTNAPSHLRTHLGNQSMI